MLAVGVGSVAFWKIRSRTEPCFFLWGASALGASVVLKSIAALASPFLESSARRFLPSLGTPLIWLYTGLLTGVFECGTTLVFARKINMLRRATWPEAVGFGVGFGGAEAMLVAMVSLAMVGISIAMPELRAELPPEYRSLTLPGPWIEYLAPALERLSAMVMHIFACALIVYAVKTAESKWFWLSFTYKTVIDALPVEAVTGRPLWFLFLPYLPFIVIGLSGILFLRRSWRNMA